MFVWSRTVVAIVVVVALTPSPTAAAVCWPPPVDAPVHDPFREPDCPWCPGNRGIEYATPAGARVVAVATGRVTFSGVVAGTAYVVVDVGAGRRVTYGRLLERHPAAGDLVVRGEVIARADTGFHLGVRLGERYVDPAPLLGRFVGRPRLVPVDGSPAAPAPPALLRCRATDPRRAVAAGAIGGGRR